MRSDFSLKTDMSIVHLLFGSYEYKDQASRSLEVESTTCSETGFKHGTSTIT